jgi:lipopolysaccharide/colanic/teichoic acid biosynthesis glycosyltransferase
MFVCEAALIAGSFLAAVYLIQDPAPSTYLIDQAGWSSIAVAEGLILLGMYYRQLYSDLRIRSRILLLQELMLVIGVVFIVEALFTYFHFEWALPRNVLLPGSGMALASVYCWRLLFAAAIWKRLGLQRVLFIGLPPAAIELAGYLGRHPEAGFALVGYLDQTQTVSENGLARLGLPGDLRDVMEQHQPDWIVIGERGEVAARQVDDLVELRFGGVQIQDVSAFCERVNGRVCSAEIEPSELIFSESFQPNPLNLRLQSMYSTIAALLAIPIVLPLIGIMALLIRARSRKPALLRDRRAGLGGAPFTMYRFRSAPQATPVNSFFVRSGLDRLPQIWNVLRGEMSLVGPEPDRPELAERLQRAIPFYAQRFLLRPGVIGWAQVHESADGSGRDAVRRLEYDLYYIKNLSPVLDLLVILRWFRETFRLGEPEDAA